MRHLHAMLFLAFTKFPTQIAAQTIWTSGSTSNGAVTYPPSNVSVVVNSTTATPPGAPSEAASLYVNYISGNSSALILQTPNNHPWGLQLFNSGFTSDPDNGLGIYQDTGGAIHFYSGGTASGNDVMDFAGEAVGVGTSSPAYKLDVEGGQVNSSGGYCINGTNCISSWPSSGNGTVTSITAGAGLSGGTISTSGTLSLDTATANAWTGAQTFGNNTIFPGGVWAASGYVGVGTGGPHDMLSISNSSNPALEITSGPYNSGKDAMLFGLATNNNAFGSSSLTGDSVISAKSGGSLDFATGPDTNTPQAVRAVIDGNGNFGIGTTDPQSELAVNGTITTTEVVVTASGWSDFVFEPDYDLKPLSEVAEYVKTNHHLPEMPPAAEVGEKGVSVGEMQAKLLAKVEELTLHLIEQDRMIQALKDQNDAFIQRMRKLEGGKDQ